MVDTCIVWDCRSARCFSSAEMGWSFNLSILKVRQKEDNGNRHMLTCIEVQQLIDLVLVQLWSRPKAQLCRHRLDRHGLGVRKAGDRGSWPWRSNA